MAGLLGSSSIRRIARTTSDVAVRQSDCRIACFDASLPADLIEQLWQDPESVVNRGKSLRDKGVRRTIRVKWRSQHYIIKQYQEPTWFGTVRHSLLSSRAWNTWAATHKFADAGILTPRTVACVENRDGLWIRDSFMMYPYVEGQTLRAFFESKPDPSRVRRRWDQLHELWQQLVQHRMTLPDSNIRNFIVDTNDDLWVIDLDRIRTHRSRAVMAYYYRRTWNRMVASVNRIKQGKKKRRKPNAARRAA